MVNNLKSKLTYLPMVKQKESNALSKHKYIYQYKYKGEDRFRVQLPYKLFNQVSFTLETAIETRNDELLKHKLKLRNLRAPPEIISNIDLSNHSQ